MKLSTAIRIGSLTTRPIKRQFFDENNGRCALGAALDAAGFNFNMMYPIAIFKLFPILDEPGSLECSLISFFADITILNDRYNLTREQIADTVERYENYLENKKQTVLVNEKTKELINV